MNWTDEEAELVATYGACEVCGGPRGMWLVTEPGKATQGLACVRHPEHGPDLRAGAEWSQMDLDDPRLRYGMTADPTPETRLEDVLAELDQPSSGTRGAGRPVPPAG